MVQHLTEDQRKEVMARLDLETLPSDLKDHVPWPLWAPKQYNASTDSCDMWTGPCACGAWHHEGK